MTRKSAVAFLGIGTAACLALSLALMLSCGPGYYDDDYYHHHHHHCIECGTTGECTAALGDGWACLDFCCQQLVDDDDESPEVDDDSAVDDDNDDNDNDNNDASPVASGSA